MHVSLFDLCRDNLRIFMTVSNHNCVAEIAFDLMWDSEKSGICVTNNALFQHDKREMPLK